MKRTDIDPGSMDLRITIQEKTETKDGAGFVTAEWADWLTNYPARLDWKSSAEYLSDVKLNAQTSAVFVMRYYPGLLDPRSGKRRIQFVDDPRAATPFTRTFDIFPPQDLVRGRWIAIPAVEVT